MNRKNRFLCLLLALSMIVILPGARIHAQEEDYRYGTVDLYSTSSAGEILHDSYYYTDGWFLSDPYDRNDPLALLSMQMTAAVCEKGSGTAFLEDLGFMENGTVKFGSTDPDDCAYTWGRKTVSEDGNDYTLVLIAIQSYSPDKDTKYKGWVQNFKVNGEEYTAEH